MIAKDSTPYFQSWPFPITEKERQTPEMAEKIEFFENAETDGFEAYCLLRGYKYGAKSQLRSGSITQLTRKPMWELKFYEESECQLLAYGNDFRIAAIAVRAWLRGRLVIEILEDIKEYLIVPSELDYSYKVYEANTRDFYQYWPFPISEGEKQSPEAIEKIEFLEDTYSDGFTAYREPEKLDYYVAQSESRAGCIMQRGRRNRWELNLSGSDPHLTAYVTNFRVAGKAVRAWLHEQPVSKILEDITEYLTVPPGAKSSYTLYRAES
jgi:hypothetical protein